MTKEAAHQADLDELLRTVVEGTATAISDSFFNCLVQNLAQALKVQFAFIGKVIGAKRDKVSTLAFWGGESFLENIEYDLAGTPCENVVGDGIRIFPDKIQSLFPNDHLLDDLGIESYLGSPVLSSTGECIGILVVMDSKPLQRVYGLEQIFKIFSARAGAELERLQIEKDLKSQKEYLRQIIDVNPNLIFVKNEKREYTLINKAFAKFYGAEVSDLIGKNPSCLKVSKERHKRFEQEDQEVLTSLREKIIPVVSARDADGNEHWFQTIKKPIKSPNGSVQILGIGIDITELKKSQKEQERLASEAAMASRLASLGELAAGVAHEINNPLNGIINYAQLMLDSSENSENSDKLKEIIREGERIASIVSNLLDLSRKHEETPVASSIKEITESSLQLMKAQMEKEKISLKVDIPDDLPRIKCRKNEIQQVFINVLSNARYALNEKHPEGGKDKCLTISARLSGSRATPYIRTVFEDNGSGIREEILPKIFDPFYSTKPHGKGTGLGLSISYGIIQSHNGKISIKSRVGDFTRAIIDLPAVE